MTQPPPDREPARRDTEREVIVTDRSSGAGMILGIILAIVAVLLVIWLVFGMNGEGDGAADVVPDDVNVTVDIDDATGGEG